MPSRKPSCRFCGKYVTRSETSARDSRFAFACGSFARNGLIGVRAAAGAPLDAALAGRGAGEEAGGGAATALAVGAATALAVGAARLGALGRGAELGGAAFGAAGAAGRGATRERAAAPLLGAFPGIIGRGGKSSGRPPGGAAGGAAGLAIGAFSATAARFASGTTFGIAVDAGVGPFGTRAGDVSSIAAARAAFARCATIASARSVVRPVLGADEFEENSSSIDDPADTVITPPQIASRGAAPTVGLAAPPGYQHQTDGPDHARTYMPQSSSTGPASTGCRSSR